MTKELRNLSLFGAGFAFALAATILPACLMAQDGDDPPTRVARLGYLEGSVSFQPAGVDDWVQAVPNRPMTTGDQLWTDQRSRAELQLGSAVIRLSENTGFSFLELDDHTVQMQLSSGSINVRVRRLDPDDYFEIDTPNLAFTASQPGSYRIDASPDGAYTVVSLRDGGGQATGSGQTYSLNGGQRGTFYGTDSLYANVENLYGPDPFDNWAYDRDHRYDQSPSAHYLSPDVVGYEDLDQNGDWRDDANYGHVWFPHIEAGWAPYHTGHWDWIEPWGYTWVDDAPWGYAPFHYGRWVSVGGRWGWVAGPVQVRAVYAPALVVFVGGGGGGFGGNVAWFPLGPREVYVPPYQVSRGYMNQVNVSNTTVNTTIVTNVYNTTIINKSTTIVNVNYVNKGVQGAVTAVPQAAFAGAQPVARAAVTVNAQQLAAAPIGVRVAVAPTHQSVLGARASTAGHVAAPPAAVMTRQVVAKRPPPPPPVPFAKQQQALAAHPGQPVAKAELQTMRPPASAAARPTVKVAPAGKPATAVVGKPAALPTAGHPVPPPTAQRPAAPAQQPAAAQHPAAPAPQNRPPAAPQNPAAAQPEYRPGNNRSEPVPSTPPVVAKPAQPPAPAAARPVPPPPAALKPAPPPPPAAKPTPPPPGAKPKASNQKKTPEKDEKQKKEKPPSQ